MSIKKSSGRITSSQVVLDGPGTYYGFVARLGTGEGQVVLHDNPTTAAGTVVDEALGDGTSALMLGPHSHWPGIPCVSGLYVTISGLTEAIVYSEPNPLQG